MNADARAKILPRKPRILYIRFECKNCYRTGELQLSDIILDLAYGAAQAAPEEIPPFNQLN